VKGGFFEGEGRGGAAADRFPRQAFQVHGRFLRAQKTRGPVRFHAGKAEPTKFRRFTGFGGTNGESRVCSGPLISRIGVSPRNSSDVQIVGRTHFTCGADGVKSFRRDADVRPDGLADISMAMKKSPRTIFRQTDYTTRGCVAVEE